jgi:hypothetical protein
MDVRPGRLLLHQHQDPHVVAAVADVVAALPTPDPYVVADVVVARIQEMATRVQEMAARV